MFNIKTKMSITLVILTAHRGKWRIDLYSSPFTLIYYPEHMMIVLHGSETHKPRTPFWQMTTITENKHNNISTVILFYSLSSILKRCHNNRSAWLMSFSTVPSFWPTCFTIVLHMMNKSDMQLRSVTGSWQMSCLNGTTSCDHITSTSLTHYIKIVSMMSHFSSSPLVT